jgi:hypothetical protein
MSNVLVSLPQGGASLDISAGGSVKLGAAVTLTVSGNNVILNGLPTSNPAVAGALWTNSGVLTRSTG